MIMAPIHRVAIIGGGPAAMFFCHALNKQKKTNGKNNNNNNDTNDGDNGDVSSEQSTNELQVTCFEKASSPGGVWRSENTRINTHQSGGEDLGAYGELWTNGSCHSLEFYDYTFDEHFQGEPVPVYLPRRDVNEYLMQRVTRNAPTFFEDYFEFDTEVVQVVSEEQVPTTGDGDDGNDAAASKGQFCVTVRQTQTGETTTRYFDKCIWAGGENAQGTIPTSLKALFGAISVDDGEQDSDATTTTTTTTLPTTSADDCSKICLLHSAETTRIRDNVKEKRVLLIGGAFSAEDLALQCLKWGATHVDVAARSNEAEVCWTTQWPGDRVVVHPEMAVKSVEKVDRSIVLEKVEFDWPYSYVPAGPEANNENKDVNHRETVDPAGDTTASATTTLQNIDTVIFCTGYKPNLSMLDDTLRPPCGSLPAWYMGTHPSLSLDEDAELNFSWDKWSMSTHKNPAHKYTGDVPAAKGKMLRINYNHPDMHRGILFKNPNMMFLCEHGSDIPLLSLDAHAWLLCSYLTGSLPIPSVPELQAANRQQVLDQMNLPYVRYCMDEGYFKVLDSLPIARKPTAAGVDEKDEASKNESDGGDEDAGYWEEGYWKASEDYSSYMLRLLARVMEEGRYPGISLGTYEELNENGKKLIDFGMSSYYMRNDLKESYTTEGGTEWRTFRDDVNEPEWIHSLYTETEARPLKKRWMDAVGATCSVKNGDI